VAINSSSKAKQDALKKQAAAGHLKDKKPNIKQMRFVDFYLHGMTSKDAYKAAGYSVNSDMAGYNNAKRLLENETVRAYLDAERARIKREFDLDNNEFIQQTKDAFLGNWVEEQVVTVLTGDGRTEARVIKKRISPKDRLKAAEILERIFGISEAMKEQTVSTKASPIAEFSKQVKKNATQGNDIDTLGTESEDLDKTIDSEVPE
jgi:phage terminase small subunit